jgi:hypothetical protein
MKKVVSIFAVALMTLGLTTYVVENSANEFDFMQDLSSMLACDDCDAKAEERPDTLS